MLCDLAITETGPLISQSVETVQASEVERLDALRAGLATSHLSLLEVTECKRGRGIRFKDRLLDDERFVANESLAQKLEPLEVVIGRLAECNGQITLLPGWEKVRFRGRKAAIQRMRDEMNEAGLQDEENEIQIAWLRRQAATTARCGREA